MRAVLTLILLAAVVLLVLVMTDVIDIRQTEGARSPAIEVQEGQMPSFDIDTAEIEVGTERREVELDVPAVHVRRPGEDDTDTAEDEAAEPVDSR